MEKTSLLGRWKFNYNIISFVIFFFNQYNTEAKMSLAHGWISVRIGSVSAQRSNSFKDLAKIQIKHVLIKKTKGYFTTSDCALKGVINITPKNAVLLMIAASKFGNVKIEIGENLNNSEL